MNIKSINGKLKKLFQKSAGFRNQFSDTYYLSIGENCLTDNILDRFKIKSFSTPYSHGRSNLDYAISLEKQQYLNLLNPDYLYYDYIGETKVVRNKYYSTADQIFNELHKNGFEFTHHDVLNNESQCKSYQRKIQRMLSFDKSKKLNFLYHYRSNDDLDISKISIKAEEFLSLYQNKGISCNLIFFSQEIISEASQRSITKIYDAKNVKGYLLKTLELWAGDNEDVLWARKDDDLLAIMIEEMK